MAIIDSLYTLADEQALTSTAASEDVVDTGAGEDAWGVARAHPDFAEGRQLFFNVAVGATGLDSSGEAATLTVALQDSADNSSFTSVLSSAALTEASVADAGVRVLSWALPVGLRRYLRAYFTVGTESFTSGTINCWIGLEPIPVV